MLGFSLNSFFTVLALFLFGCASSEVRIKDVNRPVAAVRHAILQAMPLGDAQVGKSKRKIKSKPFLLKGENFVPVSNSRVRNYAIVEILGDRRPYTIFIEVIKRQRIDGEFVSVGKDKNIAKRLVKIINYELSKSLEDANIIDDFRVF